jgi:hypothetical protein
MDIKVTFLDNNMELYIQPNLTVFPTTNILTVEAIQGMTWLGFSAETTSEQIIAAGYIAVLEPSDPQPNDTTLVVDKNQFGEYYSAWMPVTELQQILDNRTVTVFVRAKRNKLLAECDWTQAKDVPDSTSSKWTEYRQALRDITSQEGFPSNINWPQSPSGK